MSEAKPKEARVKRSKETEILAVAGREVVISSPSRIYFPEGNHTKLNVVRYLLAVTSGALRGIHNRPLVLDRYVEGVDRPACRRPACRSRCRRARGSFRPSSRRSRGFT
jgi:hypothetical protein